jgi:putative zinc finger/helix-turn-helix YgiT family protein
MICVNCRKGHVQKGPAVVPAEIRGEKFLVQMEEALVCEHCAHVTFDGRHMPEYMRLTADAYRSKHGLLTSVEIRDSRNRLQMTQEQFAGYLGVGAASIKRWELGQVQDKAMDGLIRLKADPEAARDNLKALERQVPEEHVLSSVHVHGIDLDLHYLSSQLYTRKPAMRVERLQIDSVFDNGDLLAA